MAKTSGGIRSSSSGREGKVSKGATEKGYNQKMARNITLAERTIRNNRDESMFVFSSDGNLVRTFTGKGAQVKYDARQVPENSIITHNHPRSIGEKGVKAIGNSFSRADIVSAVSTNAKEIRAVTPTYTFSVKRPKGGWGGSPESIGKAFSKASSEVEREMYGYLAKVGYNNAGIARAEATHFHRVMQKMAKQYGWDYSKKKG